MMIKREREKKRVIKFFFYIKFSKIVIKKNFVIILFLYNKLYVYSFSYIEMYCLNYYMYDLYL